jgi:uncharacterized protein with ParB-like and HNH nuclease domain/predicted transport protein
MKATAIAFVRFLKDPKQFVIPIYQRTYSWTQDQCQQLWEDIMRTGGDDRIPGHFIGSIVYIDQGLFQVAALPQLLVIDGQQRLTTLSLLIAALGKVIEEKGLDVDVTRKKLNNYYLFNAEEDGELRHKLILTQSDKDMLLRVVEERELPASSSNLIKRNYDFFLQQLRKNPADLAQVYAGISKLMIVDIALDREQDNPQLIFESLNSTGLRLSQADLIRNYILMGLERAEQTELYKNYWFPMEQSFGHAEYASYFDRFMRDYLTIKTGSIPNIGDVYAVFKHYSVGADSTAELVAEIYRYSKHYVKLAFLRDPDREINRAIADINTLKVDVAYPFLLDAYDDYTNGTIDRDVFLSILRLVESYVFRRLICGIPTNSLNKTFANLYKEIDKEDYLASVQMALVGMESYRRFPSDEEFRQELVVKDVYSLRNRNYLLRKLENYERKEIVNIESCTIEHVLPQNPELSDEWQKALGQGWKEIQAKYLHTLGNLTLTGYNPELSDKPFRTKRDMPGGFRESPLKLNRSLAKLEEWNEDEIKRRAEELAFLAARIWEYPLLSADQLLEIQVKKALKPIEKYTLEKHTAKFDDMILRVFEELRKRILNLDSSVREEIRKLYIAYKTDTNFVDIIPLKKQFRMSLNMRFDEISDPKNLCRDITGKGKWGNGDVDVRVTPASDLDDVMALIQQSFNKHFDEDGEA